MYAFGKLLHMCMNEVPFVDYILFKLNVTNRSDLNKIGKQASFSYTPASKTTVVVYTMMKPIILLRGGGSYLMLGAQFTFLPLLFSA